jgi:hypothetical protein
MKTSGDIRRKEKEHCWGEGEKGNVKPPKFKTVLCLCNV